MDSSAALMLVAAVVAAPDYGPAPALPPPEHSLIPTVKVAPVVGWREGEHPSAAAGLRVVAFARELDHPRWLYVLPNGDVLVAETNTPSQPEEGKGIRGFFTRRFMRRSGAGGDSANRITLLRDTDGDGVADERSVFIDALNSPFGMALVAGRFFVASTDALLGFPYEKGQLHIGAAPTLISALPGGPRNHHWTKSLIASPDGRKLYVGVGSNSNVAENGLAAEDGRAAVWEIDVRSGASRVFASGLRNPVGLAFEPHSGALWVAVNERDELGDAVPPDYMTSLRDGGFYGWPYSYFGAHVDDRVQPQRPDLVAKALVPDYALGAHTASLGLAAAQGNSLAARFADGMFVGQHGSWNRKPPSGYRVIFVPFTAGKPGGPPEEVLGGFLNAEGQARGRPVGVVLDARGALLVADDVGNAIWRVSAAR